MYKVRRKAAIDSTQGARGFSKWRNEIKSIDNFLMLPKGVSPAVKANGKHYAWDTMTLTPASVSKRPMVIF